jgi:hypothetical protein
MRSVRKEMGTERVSRSGKSYPAEKKKKPLKSIASNHLKSQSSMVSETP